MYPNCNFALKPVSDGKNMPVPSPPSPEKLEFEEPSIKHERIGSEACESEEGTEEWSNKKLTLINQSMSNDLVQDLRSTKDKAVILRSWLKQ